MRDEEIGEIWPEIPEWADPRELDAEVRRDLRGLSKEGAEFVGAHLLMAGMLAEEDPTLAWRHARAARSQGGRIAVVRETVGLVAYRAGEWAEAIAELRAARRMSGGPGQLPVIADSERALGHPDRAIELSRSAEAADLDPSSAAELRIVVAGARADLGQLDAALAHLEVALRPDRVQPFSARLFYAYADLLLQADRRAEAVEWFMKAAEVDTDEDTDAEHRLMELAGENSSVDIDIDDSNGDDLGRADDDGQAAHPDDRAVGHSVLDVPSGDRHLSEAGNDETEIDEGEESAESDSDEDVEEDLASGSEVDEADVDAAAADAAEPDVAKVDAAEPDAARVDAAEVDVAEQNGASSGIRPAGPPSPMSSLFSHDEGGL